MLINFNQLKTFYSALIQKMKGFRGNWNQNDPTADDYIKNRTHWEEIVQGKITFVPEMTVSISSNGGYQQLLDSVKLTAGEKYTVILNGITYECIARDFNGGTGVIIGNGTIYGDGVEGNGEPFSCDNYPGEGGTIYLNVATAGTYTISIYSDETRTIVHKLDKKFIDIPDGLVTEEDVMNLMDENLAPVAWTNNYNSLSGKPTIYTDVVRYDEIQSLAEYHKARARNNIGASDFSGSYDDLIYKPCGIETTRTEFFSEIISGSSLGHNSNIRWAVLSTNNTKMPTESQAYEIRCCKNNGKQEIYRACFKAVAPSKYSGNAITIGNAYLFDKDCPDTKEPICVMFYGNGQINGYASKKAFGTEAIWIYINEITEGVIHQLDERLIPNSFAKVEDGFIETEVTEEFSWDLDISNRDSFSWDSQIEFYKIADKKFSANDITTSNASENYMTISEIGDSYYIVNGVAVFDNAGKYTIDTHSVVEIPSPGIYFYTTSASGSRIGVESATITYKARTIPNDIVGIARTVNNIEPDTNGNVALVASDIGAATTEYVNNAVAQKSQVQIITWEADD